MKYHIAYNKTIPLKFKINAFNILFLFQKSCKKCPDIIPALTDELSSGLEPVLLSFHTCSRLLYRSGHELRQHEIVKQQIGCERVRIREGSADNQMPTLCRIWHISEQPVSMPRQYLDGEPKMEYTLIQC